MTPEKQTELEVHIQAIAEILYQQAEPNQIETLADIEQILKYITPKIGFFSRKHHQN